MENEDKLIRQFYQEQSRDIEDNGFTERIIQNLPKRDKKRYPVWEMFCLGMCGFLFFILNGWDIVANSLHSGTLEKILNNTDTTTLIVAGLFLILGLIKIAYNEVSELSFRL